MHKLIVDEVDQKHGRLTVIKSTGSNMHGQATWLCECECGNRIETTGLHLRSGHTRSCGCLHFKEMVGQKFGRLTVIERVGSNKGGDATWLCACECGNETVVTGANLRSGGTRSCGCSSFLPEGEASFNQIFSSMKHGAKRRKHEWQLTKEQMRTLTQQPCHYCGAEPNQGNYSSARNGVYLYNGLDRVNNDLGYIIDNVVPCCGTCNAAKNTQTIEQFKTWIHAVNEHFVSQFY